jgi:magnesium-transporting ATPase (P-type)
MVTGDQTLTAASIAYQTDIIKDLDDAPEIIKDREGLATLEKADIKSNV